MINFDDITKEHIKEHDSNRSEIPDHPYGRLIVGDSGSGKTNALFNLINHEPDIEILINLIYMVKIHVKQNINF